MNARVDEGFDIEYPAKKGPKYVRSKRDSQTDSQEHSPSRFDLDRIMNSIRNFAGISELLRILGATVLVASMSLFLLQGWNDGNDVRRYLMLLTQTGLLAGAGFALSHGLKEAKGARMFFGLALISIPANFTILGALLYSVFQWDGGLTTYPDFAAWQVDSIANIGITVVGAMAVLIPVTLFCFAVMARHSTKTLSLSFLALNLVLLLPIRNSVAAGTIALLGILYASYFVRTVSAKDPALKTPEGKFALTTLFIPAGIILFRSMYFYQVDSLMIAMLSLAAFLAARHAATLPDQNSRVVRGLEIVSLPVALIFGIAVADVFTPVKLWALIAPLFTIGYTALALDVMRRTDSSRLSKGIGVSISLFTASSFIWAVAIQPSAITAFLSVIAGVLMLLVGVSARNRTASLAGAVTMIGGAMYGYDSIVALVVNSSWVDLAIFGASAIVIGSTLDRHGVAIKLRMSNWVSAINGRNKAVALDD